MNPFETKSGLDLDAAVNAACDAFEPQEWTAILRALDGHAPSNRTPAGKLLRRVRDVARRRGVAPVVEWEKQVVRGEARVLTEEARR